MRRVGIEWWLCGAPNKQKGNLNAKESQSFCTRQKVYPSAVFEGSSKFLLPFLTLSSPHRPLSSLDFFHDWPFARYERC